MSVLEARAQPPLYRMHRPQGAGAARVDGSGAGASGSGVYDRARWERWFGEGRPSVHAERPEPWVDTDQIVCANAEPTGRTGIALEVVSGVNDAALEVLAVGALGPGVQGDDNARDALNRASTFVVNPAPSGSRDCR